MGKEAVEIEQIIAVIHPQYSQNPNEIINALNNKKNKENKDISAALKIAKPQSIWEHKIVYDSTSEQLEPIYFWILDFLSEALGMKTEKLVDNFAASPGGGFFSEIGAKATKMQEEGMKIMGMVNTVIKSIINLIYDLKDFEIRLAHYDQANSADPKKAEAGLLALKQIWVDKVDSQKGYGSINAMARAPEIGFYTLRDAFFAVKTLEDVDKLDLNDRVKRVLKPRVAEFLEWRKRSEQELRKRFEIEKAYLKSQVATLKLYTRWAKPYLKAAEELGMRAGGFAEGITRKPELVNAFNTMLLELTIFAKKEFNPKSLAEEKLIPMSFRNKKFNRKYFGCILLKFTFRGIPYRTPQGHYVFGGRAEISMKAYALNEDELKIFDEELKKEDLAAALSLVEEVTETSIKELSEDIEHFLEDKEENKKEGKKKEGIDKNKKDNKKIDFWSIKKDNFEESILRAYIEKAISGSCFKLYDTFKKSRGWASFTEPEWETEEVKRRIYSSYWKG